MFFVLLLTLTIWYEYNKKIKLGELRVKNKVIDIREPMISLICMYLFFLLFFGLNCFAAFKAHVFWGGVFFLYLFIRMIVAVINKTPSFTLYENALIAYSPLAIPIKLIKIEDFNNLNFIKNKLVINNKDKIKKVRIFFFFSRKKRKVKLANAINNFKNLS